MALIYNLNIDKGVDFSTTIVLQKANGEYVDLSDSGTCVKAGIVEFYGCPALTGFTTTKILPSGVELSLNEEGTMILTNPSYYDVVLSISGATERLRQGVINTSEAASLSTACL